jgi:anion-transporting  ArsA/GET3 family ATPase
MSITPLDAAFDYLHRYHGIDRLSRPLLRTGGLNQVVTGAPGFRDLLVAGKIYELARARAGDAHATDPIHDLIVVDAPPTGQLAAFLSAPAAFADLVRVGPMKRRASNVAAMFASRARVVVVTIPEEMAVAETLEALPAVRKTGVALAGVIVNRLEPGVFPPGTARAAKALDPERAVSLAAEAGLRLDEPAAEGILHTAAEGARRTRSAHRMAARLRGKAPMFELPDISFLPAGDRVSALAGSMEGDGAAPDRIVKPPDHSTRPTASQAGERLDGPLGGARIVVVCGSGGVGKTTVSAAIALHAASAGHRTVLLTVDPARRLATALRLPTTGGDRTAIRVGPGRSMEALQLDTKRTFDELVERFARDPGQRARIMANPFYRRAADTLGGTHEYMAMEKLHQLAEEEDHDVIVIDTPPTRSALSFLDAPKRLTDFLGGRFLRLMLWPTAVAGRLTLSAARFGARAMLRTVGRLVGAETLADTVEFLAAFEGMYGGFRARAARVMELLASPECAFVLAAAPTGPSLAEAGQFVERLRAGGMRSAAVVVNRFDGTEPAFTIPSGPAAADGIDRLAGGTPEERGLAAAIRFACRTEARRGLEAEELDAFLRTYGDVPLVTVPDLGTEVHDVSGLRRVAARLFEPVTESHEAPRALA